MTSGKFLVHSFQWRNLILKNHKEEAGFILLSRTFSSPPRIFSKLIPIKSNYHSISDSNAQTEVEMMRKIHTVEHK